MALKPCGGCDPRFGKRLEEEVECLLECRWHVFQDESSDTVRACGFMVGVASECLLHDGRCDLACDHRDRRSRRGSDISSPGEWGARGESGVRGECYGF